MCLTGRVRNVHNPAALVPARVYRVLRHEGPAGLAGPLFEQGLDCCARLGLVGDIEVDELVEDRVIGFDGAAGGGEVEGGQFS